MNFIYHRNRIAQKGGLHWKILNVINREGNFKQERSLQRTKKSQNTLEKYP